MMRSRLPALPLGLGVLLILPPIIFAQSQPSSPPQNPTPTPAPAKPQGQQQGPPAETIPSPVSRHYPILIIGHGNEPSWSLRIGMKGPERLDRVDYPPIVLEPTEVTIDQPTGAWTYNAKDSATGVAVAVKLTRAPCSDNTSDTRYTFRVDIQHAQLGTLTGCGQSAPDKFPEFRKKNQIDMPEEIDPNAKDKDAKDKDKDKDKKSVLEPITKFQSPIDLAYLDTTGRVILARGTVRKAVAPSGSELAVSHDGKKLLFTSSSKTSPEQSVVLYETDTGHSRQIANNARQAFWSPDDSRIAFLKSDGQFWEVWTAPASTPENATLLSSTHVDALNGWLNATTVLASDLQNAYWISEDRPAQIVPLKDMYGPAFQVTSSDTIRVCPINPDLLLISAYYQAAPAGAPVDGTGLNATFFLYEVRSKRRTILGPLDSYSRGAEWSRDALQIFFTKGVPGKAPLVTDRIFWDGTGEKRYSGGTELVVGK